VSGYGLDYASPVVAIHAMAKEDKRRPERAVFDPPLTAEELYRLLQERYETFGHEPVGSGFFREVPVATGTQENIRRLDAWRIEAWPSKGFARHAFEVKVSRADWLRELKDPRKRRPMLRFANSVYVVANPGVVKLDELPPELGLLEPRRQGEPRGTDRLDGVHLQQIVNAPWLDSSAPSWSFVVALLRVVWRSGFAAAEGSKQALRDAIEAFVDTVDREAESDMLAGGPITGAHSRAIDRVMARGRFRRAKPVGIVAPEIAGQ
jgi:hypothetical protein